MGATLSGHGLVAEQARRYADRDPAHERRVVVAAVLATLGIVAGPALAGALGLGADFVRVEEPALTTTAQRVLTELPGAYETGGLVVVPAAGDPTREWDNVVRPGLIDGPVVELGVNGLVEYAGLPVTGDAPIWLSTVTASDRIYSDVGPLYYACTRYSDQDTCAGTLLMEHAGELLVHRFDLGLGVPGETPSRFRAIEPTGPSQLLMGTAPPTTAAVLVEHAGDERSEMWASTHESSAPGRARLWWVSTTMPVESVRFLDAAGRSVGRAGLSPARDWRVGVGGGA